MKNILKAVSILIAFLPLAVQAQDYSQVRRNSNVWVAQCKSCHTSHNDLAKEAGIRTEQYFFNFIYEHENAEKRIFGDILPGYEIQFVARFILIAAYLNKLESDMRKAGDHLMKNIKL